MNRSSRCLGGMVEKAKRGEWMGGPVKLGFDVACFDRATGEELWRVVFEGREKVGTMKRRGKERPVYRTLRLKVYPDGRTERLDGKVTFRTSKDMQVMRITPTREKAKLEAAQGVFHRYATEAVTFFGLAKWLNELGIRNSYGNQFQSIDIRKMLSDEAYLGDPPPFAKQRSGRFHRHTANGIVVLEPSLRGKSTASDPAGVIRSSTRLFEPLIDRATWDAVQKKLLGRGKGTRAPKNPGPYLAGLLVCGNCGKPMVGRGDRRQYYCGTWHRHQLRGTLAESPCTHNGVYQDVLEEYVNRYLEETGKRLELLIEGPDGSHLTDRLNQQEAGHCKAFTEGVERVTAYLVQHPPEEYADIWRQLEAEAAAVADVRDDQTEQPRKGSLADHLGPEGAEAWEKHKNDPVTPGGFVDACLACYRANFDPAGLKAKIGQLDAEHTALTHRDADLPTPRAKEKAKAELAQLEARIEELVRQQQDAAEAVEKHFREMLGLQQAIADAKLALQSEAGEQALRGILCRIECEFVATGKRTRGGPGQAGSRLVALHFLPIAGDSVRTPVTGGQPNYGLAQ